jgi:hypothetical protein
MQLSLASETYKHPWQTKPKKFCRNKQRVSVRAYHICRNSDNSLQQLTWGSAGNSDVGNDPYSPYALSLQPQPQPPVGIIFERTPKESIPVLRENNYDDDVVLFKLAATLLIGDT